MPFYSYFDEPENYKDPFGFYEQGGSPSLLQEFINTIEKDKNNIEEINISWYLFNNQYLYNYLKEVATIGIKVNVITIPLEGYDNNNPKALKNLETKAKTEERFTKYNLARKIFGETYRSTSHKNLNLYIFSHLYVRSANIKKFSRGTLPYSLHIKSAYIKKKNGYLVLMSSSNLAVRDLVKYESMICIENEPGYEETAKAFYKNLIENSIPIKAYKSSLNTTCNMFEKVAYKFSGSMYISAPFYENSANNLEKKLLKHIASATHRIIICAQHLAAFNYDFNANHHSTIDKNEIRQGILGMILKIANNGVRVTCLSQTFAPLPNNENKFKNAKFRKPVNTRNFQKFYGQLQQTDNIEYYVNNNIHSKYIIIDHILIFCSYNFTPTQFIYLDNVKIDKFKNMSNVSYTGIHCEVGIHTIIKDPAMVAAFENNAMDIIRKKNTIQVK
ncbi:phospholipase D-like domain-containing protein [Maribacter litoralis]|uniref:phospholipase D-like domain-containing protein n=1 Tax=Maribacter litoralis TaxID=2059726 RepID=UPI003D293E71